MGDGVSFSLKPMTTAKLSTGAARSSWRHNAVARFWTADALQSDGGLVANSTNRYGFTSQEIVRRSDGSFEIVVAPRANSGNWLPTGGVERYELVLRLYDTAGRRFDQGRPRSPDAGGHTRSCP